MFRLPSNPWLWVVRIIFVASFTALVLILIYAEGIKTGQAKQYYKATGK